MSLPRIVPVSYPLAGLKRAPKRDRDAALAVVEKYICDSGLKPGFDYAATVRELLQKYAEDQIALACDVGKTTVGKWLAGKTIPRHDRGERLFILYCETFTSKEDREKRCWKKPPVKKLVTKGGESI